VGRGDFSCPAASQLLSPLHWGLSPLRRAPASQPVCRAPSSPDKHATAVPGEGAWGWTEGRAPASALSCHHTLSAAPLLSSFSRCELATGVWRGESSGGLHCRLSEQPRKGNCGHFQRGCSGIFCPWPCVPSHAPCLPLCALAARMRIRRWCFSTASACCSEPRTSLACWRAWISSATDSGWQRVLRWGDTWKLRGRGPGPPAPCEDSAWARVRVCWHWVPASARSHPSRAPQMLLDEEPRDQLNTSVRQLAMDAIAELRYLPVPLGDPAPQVRVPLHEASRHRSQHQCPTGPPLSLQHSAECDGGQREKPPSSLLQERLLASSKRTIRSPAPFRLLLGKGWVSYRSPQSLWAAPWSGCDRRPEAGRGLRLASPSSSLRPLPVGSARSRQSAPASLPGSARQGRSPPLVPGGQVSLLLGKGTMGMAATALCLPCRLCQPWTTCYTRCCSAILPPGSVRGYRVSFRSGTGKTWASQGLLLTLGEGGDPRGRNPTTGFAREDERKPWWTEQGCFCCRACLLPGLTSTFSLPRCSWILPPQITWLCRRGPWRGLPSWAIFWPTNPRWRYGARHPPARPPPPSPCTAEQRCSGLWGFRALYQLPTLTLSAVLPVSPRPGTTLERTWTGSSATETSTSWSWEGCWDVSSSSSLPAKPQPFWLHTLFVSSSNSWGIKPVRQFGAPYLRTEMSPDGSGSPLPSFTPHSRFPQHPSSRFAAEAECSPEGQHLFSAALLPPSFQDLEPHGFMVPTDKATIDHHAPKPCLPCSWRADRSLQHPGRSHQCL